jgi:hypothetical protein
MTRAVPPDNESPATGGDTMGSFLPPPGQTDQAFIDGGHTSTGDTDDASIKPSGYGIVQNSSATPIYGPDIIIQPGEFPPPQTVVNEPLPRAWGQGGVIEAVKRTVIKGLRDQFANSSLDNPDQAFYIDIEYPTKPTQYPGVWVQFSISSLKRAGIGMETWTQDDAGNWGPIHEMMFEGSITLTCAAITSKDRDRLADVVMPALAFARPPDMIIYNSATNTNQLKGLITAINNNPYVKMTLNTDVVHSGGQTATEGTPWTPNILLYEDNYSVTCQGQFNLRYSLDGVYTLAAIQVVPTIMAGNVAYNPNQWGGGKPQVYPGSFNAGQGGSTAPGSGFAGQGPPTG